MQSTHTHVSQEVPYQFWVSEVLRESPMQALSSASIGWGWSVVVYLNAVTTVLWM